MTLPEVPSSLDLVSCVLLSVLTPLDYFLSRVVSSASFFEARL